MKSPKDLYMGPRLFLICVMDLSNGVENTNIRLFADDTTIIGRVI